MVQASFPTQAFSTSEMLTFDSHDPLLKEPHFPTGFPKLAKSMPDMVFPPWHDNSSILPS
ncbi:hypothetical protein TorRG33x02_232330 [Trema orientale]|uniref:Uncharacterized protein n=1 Tax=Trema orientale TaxID=63057 RepID=A0A2P5E645_TREOI|nr:hypothetical protein TorRG33x02_232330 [Trema orientale]